MKIKAGTRAEKLREAIEEGIATGAFAPGMHLDETELAQRFGVSRTPLREALIQLSSMGIVVLRPRRGALVAEITPQRLLEMFEVMAELEAMCGRLAARRMAAADHAVLMRAHKACEVACRAEDPDAYYHENEQFHYAIYAGSHSGFLIEQTTAMHRCESGIAWQPPSANITGSLKPSSRAMRKLRRSACASTSSCRANALPISWRPLPAFARRTTPLPRKLPPRRSFPSKGPRGSTALCRGRLKLAASTVIAIGKRRASREGFRCRMPSPVEAHLTSSRVVILYNCRVSGGFLGSQPIDHDWKKTKA